MNRLKAKPILVVSFANLSGEVPEWPNGTVSKTVVRATAPWVRIPPSPHPQTKQVAQLAHHYFHPYNSLIHLRLARHIR